MLGRGNAGLAVRLVVVVLLGLGIALLGAGGAQAHAYLVTSNPGDGSTVAAAPAELRLGFSEHVVLNATRITLTDSAGHQVTLAKLRLVTADATDTEEPGTVAGTLPNLARGTWRVSWETLSSDDLHRTAGFFVFGVGTSVGATPFHESAPSAGDAALGAALLIALALVLGGSLAFQVLTRVPGDGAARARSTVTGVVRAAVLAGLVVTVVQPLEQTRRGGISLAELAASSYGLRWSVRELGLLVLLAAAWSLGGAGLSRRTRWLLGIGAPLAATGTALLGHAAAGSRVHLDRVLVTGVHLLAALTWSGAVLCLALVIVWPRISRGLPVPPLRATLRGFALPASACIGTLAVTGLYLASGTVVSVDAALRTIYGRTLLVKLLLIGVAGGLALVNHRRLRGPRDLHVPSRTLALEASAAVLLVLASGVLVSSQPATDPQLVDTPTAVTLGPVSRQVQDLQQTVGVSPNRPGAAVVSVTVFDTRRPSPGPITDVLVGLGADPRVAATPVGDGRWVVPVTNLPPGPSRIHVRVIRSGVPAVASTVTWTVARASGPPPTLVSRSPIHTPLLALSGASGLGLLVVAAGVIVLARRRRLDTARTGSAVEREPSPSMTSRT